MQTTNMLHTVAPGRLILTRVNAPLGPFERYDFYECQDCHTTYPKMTKIPYGQDEPVTAIFCNGRAIEQCPWCRLDSHPWMYGRGI